MPKCIWTVFMWSRGTIKTFSQFVSVTGSDIRKHKEGEAWDSLSLKNNNTTNRDNTINAKLIVHNNQLTSSATAARVTHDLHVSRQVLKGQRSQSGLGLNAAFIRALYQCQIRCVTCMESIRNVVLLLCLLDLLITRRFCLLYTSPPLSAEQKNTS